MNYLLSKGSKILPYFYIFAENLPLLSNELAILTLTAASLGFFHTLFGPDHYLPFIVMSRARKWSLLKTGWITFLCGLGHIGSSVLLGIIGIVLGIAVTRLEFVESFRGSIAAWLLIAFGFVYMIWGIRKAFRNRQHTHIHVHGDGQAHQHVHSHHEDHVHIHESERKQNLTPWILFTIFIFGPCEPLIPLLMYPAAQESTSGILWVTTVFGGITILTMVSIVLVTTFGISLVRLRKVERYTHVIAGATIMLCGVAIEFLGV